MLPGASILRDEAADLEASKDQTARAGSGKIARDRLKAPRLAAHRRVRVKNLDTEVHMIDRLDLLMNEIKRDDFKVISFDLFDTLIRRKVTAPEHVFWTIAEQVAEKLNDRSLTWRIYDARHLAGALSQHRARQRGREDSTLAEIYDTLGVLLPEARHLMAEVMALEIEEERRALEPYPLGARLYAAAQAAGKRIIISSDQYLPIAFLEERLKAFGFTGYEKFLLSGDVGLLKTTGSLYEWMPMRLGVERREILHIGDNPFVDVEVAVRKGLRGELMPRSDALAGHPGRQSAAAVHPTLGSYAVAAYLNRLADDRVAGAAPQPRDDIDFIGYTFYGPLLCYLAAWVSEALRRGDIERLWLLARDSEGLSKVFPLLYPELADRVDYVYASRRMLVYPTGALTGVEIFRHYERAATSNPTVREFLDRISTEEADFTPVARFFQPDDRIDDPHIRHELERRLTARGVELGADRGSPALTRLRGYYDAAAKGAKRIGLFDLGWRGNLQRAMEQLFTGSDVTFTGYYVGQIFEGEIIKPHINAQAYAFSYDFPGHVFQDVLYNIWPLELIFSGTEPSAIGVRQTEDGWQPVFEDDTPQKQATRQVAERLQASALAFVRDVVLKDPRLVPHPGNVKQGVELLRQFLAHPGPIDAGALADFTWAMNIEDHGKPLIARPKAQTGEALSDARAASSWPAGFDVLQDETALNLMRKHWRQNEKKRHRREKLRRRLRKPFG